MTVIDVDEAAFEREVIERSHTAPVVVDFWAAWCAPCRQLGPLLEAAATAREGAVILAKIDTDASPALAQRWGIQGIPAVKAFRDGELVDEFVGVQPRAAVEAFFDALAPSETDRLLAAGDQASLRRAFELSPARSDVAVALARIEIARGELDAAERLLEAVPADFAADGLRARISLRRDGRLGEALDAIDAGDAGRAFELLLAALAQADHPSGGAGGEHESVRQVIVGELSRLAPDEPLARDTRRRLAAALF